MDDMKKLVEKYKRELMEFSRASAVQPPKKLEFPEMTEVDSAVASEITVSDQPQETTPARSPQIIGYSGDGSDVMDAFGDVFSELAEQMTEEKPDGMLPLPEEAPEITQPDAEGQADNGVTTVTPETAERLDDIPESGAYPEEQLAKRDFEEQSETVNPVEDIQPLVQSGAPSVVVPEREYSSLQEYVDVNNRRGMVRFRTYTARGALPVPNVRIVVSKTIGGKKHVFYSLTTDESGQTAVISLPAPPKELSEAPDSAVTPYSVYDAEVTAQGFSTVIIKALPVFDGITSVQRIALVPDVGQVTEITPETEPDLNGGA
ncbi:MAG: hypothetical protein IJZ95_00165 [Oscillospiraceae bacterium]|nr:hypothetical protein [Oscillospiraceae bacterium]